MNQLAAGAVTSAKLADGAALTELLDDDGAGSGLDADLLDGLNASAFWQLGGNAGTTPGTQFLGTSDNQPLELRVNNLRTLRLEPNTNGAPNMIGGSPVNSVAAGVVGATISGGGATIFMGVANTNSVAGDFGSIGGGRGNTIHANALDATIGGGELNTIQAAASRSTIGGGIDNTIQMDAWRSTIGGGDKNTIHTNANGSTIGGGRDNTIGRIAVQSTIAGGAVNTIGTNASFAAIGGGSQNTIQPLGSYATIPGGFENEAANYAFAAGTRAKANHRGAFVWADSQLTDFASTASNQFLIRASSGVGIGTASPEADLHIRGNSTNGSLIITPNTADSRSQILLAENTTASLGFIMRYAGDVSGNPLYFIPLDIGAVEGAPIMTLERSGGAVGIGTTNPASALHVIGTVTATAFNPPSDRNLKENFTGVSPREVLDKVAGLTITRWNFKTDAATPHLGPMAQDFHAAFGLGTDDKHIATVDADGVALAAIQGLNQKVEGKMQQTEAGMEELRRENAELKARLEKLENLLAREK